MSLRTSVTLFFAAVTLAAAASARADTLELHGSVTDVNGREADVDVGEEVRIVVTLDRQVLSESPLGDESYYREYNFEPSDQYVISVSFESARVPEIEVPGLQYLINQAQVPHTFLSGSIGRGDGEVEVVLHLWSNGINDVILHPLVELHDYQFAEFQIWEDGVVTIEGVIEWAMPVRAELSLLGDINAGIDNANTGIDNANTGIDEANAGIGDLGTLLAEVANAAVGVGEQVNTVLANQDTIIANQASDLAALQADLVTLRTGLNQILANQETILATQATILANQEIAERKLNRILLNLLR